MRIIVQTLNINNFRATSATSINLHTIRKLIGYFFRKVFVKAMFTITLFEILRKTNLKVLVDALSSVKSNLLRILNLLDLNNVQNLRVLIIISNNEKYILKCKDTHKKKLNHLIPGYEVNPTRFLHDPNKVIFNVSSNVFRRRKKFTF